MKRYLLLVLCTLLAILGCSRKWDNPVESAVPLPGVPGLISPANNAWIWNAQNTITFTWSKVSGATKYKLLLSNYSAVSDSFVAMEIADTFYNWTDTNKLGKMYWQVKAWNPINEWKISSIYTFEKGPYILARNGDLSVGMGYVQFIYENYFYIGSSFSFRIYDISDYNKPIYIKTVDYPRVIGDCTVLSDNLLYMTSRFDDGDGLSIATLSDPLNPTEIGHITTTSYVDISGRNYGLAIKDTIAYVVNYWKGLFLVNIKNPTNPINITSCYFDRPSFKVTVFGNYAYVAREDSGLIVVDVTNPSIPYIVNRIIYPESYINNVYAYNDILYATGHKFSLANPTNPILLNEGPYFGFHKITVLNTIIYGGKYIFSNSDLSVLGKCDKINNDTLLYIQGYGIKNNNMFCGINCYKPVNGGIQDLGARGIVVFKLAP